MLEQFGSRPNYTATRPSIMNSSDANQSVYVPTTSGLLDSINPSGNSNFVNSALASTNTPPKTSNSAPALAPAVANTTPTYAAAPQATSVGLDGLGQAISPQARPDSLAGSEAVSPEAVAGADGTTGSATDWMKQFGGFEGIAGGLKTLGNLYMAYQQNKLAKQEFNFQKSSYNTNLANSTKSYNTELEKSARARLSASGNIDELDDYVAANKL